MELLDEEFSILTVGYTKPGSLKRKPLLDVKQAVGMGRTLSVDLLEVLIFGIHPFDYLKSKDLGL